MNGKSWLLFIELPFKAVYFILQDVVIPELHYINMLAIKIIYSNYFEYL